MFHLSSRLMLVSGTVLLLAAGLPWLWGQDAPHSKNPPPAVSSTTDVPTPSTTGSQPAKMTVQQRHLLLSAQRATDWLQRANKPDGRFVHGFLPALRVPLEGDSYLRQVGAAAALGRAARFLKDEQADAIAQQAVLSLLLETTTDPREPQVRFTSAPSSLLNRTAVAGLLVLAVHELPVPGKDMLEAADQLSNFLQRQVQKDGSLALTDAGEASKVAEDEAIEHFSGPALHGIIRSQARRPAPWKIECLRKAVPYYQAWWQRKKTLPMVPEHTAAYAEAYVLTRDQDFADAVFALNDWLCGLQYRDMEPRRSQWTGGFMPWVDGKAATSAPDIRSAAAAASLAQACRVAHLAGDVARHKRYKDAVEHALQFLTTLQYTEANTQHFAEWYRPLLVGGFFASPQDGNLRLDYTQHALTGLVVYLQQAAELP